MKGRLSKASVLFLALVLALGGVGAAFSAWTDTITISGTVDTGVLEWEFDQGSQIQKPDDPDWNCFWDLETGIAAADPEGKNVANTTVVIEAVDNPHSMTVTINNAYPYYYDHIAFSIHALGSIPLRIWKVNFLYGNGTLVDTFYTADDEYVYLDLDGLGGYDLEIYWGNNFGLQRHESQHADISFKLLVLQPLPQGEALSFTIEMVAIQWNEYVAGPLL